MGEAHGVLQVHGDAALQSPIVIKSENQPATLPWVVAGDSTMWIRLEA